MIDERTKRRLRFLRKTDNIPAGIDLHVYPDGYIGWVAREIHRSKEWVKE
jgi:hypothetical protein